MFEPHFRFSRTIPPMIKPIPSRFQAETCSRYGALKGKTPKEYLMQKLQNHVSSVVLHSPLKNVQEVG